MAFTLNNLPVQSITLKIPMWGIWTARVKLAADKVLAAGAVAKVVIGDLTLTGTIRQGGVFQSSAEYIVVGGADGWAGQVTRKNYRTDAGGKLFEVATDLGTDVGERVVLQPNTDRSVGYAWSRAAGSASAALDALGTRWWVSAEGITYLGTRGETAIPKTVKWTLESYDPANRLAVIGVNNDTLKAFQPGVRIKSSDIDIVAGSIVATVTDRRIVVEVRS